MVGAESCHKTMYSFSKLDSTVNFSTSYCPLSYNGIPALTTNHDNIEISLFKLFKSITHIVLNSDGSFAIGRQNR